MTDAYCSISCQFYCYPSHPSNPHSVGCYRSRPSQNIWIFCSCTPYSYFSRCVGQIDKLLSVQVTPLITPPPPFNLVHFFIYNSTSLFSFKLSLQRYINVALIYVEHTAVKHFTFFTCLQYNIVGVMCEIEGQNQNKILTNNIFLVYTLTYRVPQ